MALHDWQREQILREIDFEAVRSRGPGGQNVNKVSSAAVLYWCPLTSGGLLEDQRSRLLNRLGGSINKSDHLVIRSDEYRDLPMNKSRCVEKLFTLIDQALHVPKKRKATKPTYSSKKKLREAKSRRSDVKKMRGKVRDYGD